LSWAVSKDETEGGGAEFDGNRCIFVICYTADLYRYIIHFNYCRVSISPALTISAVLAAGSLLFIRAEPTRTA